MKEAIPQERHETVRQEIVRLLSGRKLSASLLSQRVRKSEKEIYSHLDQIKKSVDLMIISAECGQCGYQFKNREKTRKPGKCPHCKSSHIEQPQFYIRPV